MEVRKLAGCILSLSLVFALGCGDDDPGSGVDAGERASTDGGRRDAGDPNDAGESGEDATTTPTDAGGNTDTDAEADDAGQPPPECTYEDENVCDGNQDRWCGGGSCVACEEGMFNCDLTRGCECEGGCDGMACMAGNTCEGGVEGECGSDARWCYEGHPSGTPMCRDCTDGFKNCDGVAGCEFTCPRTGPCECP